MVEKKASSAMRQKGARTGDAILVRYFDCVLFKDVPSTTDYRPVVRETIGWLDYEDNDLIRLIWERYAESAISEQSRIKVTGLALRKCDVIEVVKIG